jgi:branched-chain amino acid transport system permease protein
MIMAILGGSTDFRGPLLGATILTLISEAFGIRFPYHYMILLGVTLILIVKFLPMGLLGAIRGLRIAKKQYGSLLSS